MTELVDPLWVWEEVVVRRSEGSVGEGEGW
jgi:hypothetical protein